jgi:hypothetical protein
LNPSGSFPGEKVAELEFRFNSIAVYAILHFYKNHPDEPQIIIGLK